MTTVQEVLEVLNDIRRCSEAIVGEFKDVGDHYEYVGSDKTALALAIAETLRKARMKGVLRFGNDDGSATVAVRFPTVREAVEFRHRLADLQTLADE